MRLAGAAAALCLAAAPARGQDATATPSAAFRFSPEAGRAVRALWDASVAAGEERVACLGAARRGDSVLVGRVLPLVPEAADSTGISAQASIDRCGPPQWAGTIHTHVALYTADGPSRRFSGQDRVAMSLWRDRWRVHGIFCVVYSGRDALCEAEGVAGSAQRPTRQPRLGPGGGDPPVEPPGTSRPREEERQHQHE